MRIGKTAIINAAVLAGCTVANVAAAQETVLVAPPALPDYDRGRNVSVLQRGRPDYDALGIRRGSFLIYPRVVIGAGVTDNVYLTETNKDGDGYAIFSPSVLATSDWSRHQLSVGGGATLRRYFEETPRNQDEWYLNALGRADFGGNFSLTAEAQAAQSQESPFGGAVQANVAALSSYQRRTGIVRGQYVLGRTRATLSYDFNGFDFDDVTFDNGTRLSQADRDRNIHRVTAQVEYALSPSFSVYGQIGYAKTDYERALLSGQANRDSNAYRIIGGVNFDLSAFFRGSVGVGYVARDYKSALYNNVSGPSIEARIEYFPTQLTTVTLNARRLLDDSNISGTSALFDNQIGVRVDHELLDNLLLNANASYTHQQYIDSSLRSDIYRFELGGRYLVSRSVQLQASLGRGGRSQNQSINFGSVKELTAEFGIVLQR